MPMKDSHAEKGAHNQALLREVNERIEGKGREEARPAFAHDLGVLRFASG
jgi:hypothetical protein